MCVYSPLSSAVDDENGTWRYRIRKLNTYTGYEFVQYCYSDGTAGNWTYGSWEKVIKTSDIFVKSGTNAKAGLVPAPSTTAGTTKYLREDGTWQVPPDNNTTYSNATTSAAGLMSATDKAKLDGIAAGANNYTYTLPTASSSTLGGVKIGSNINISSGTISVADANGSTKGVTIVYPADSCTTFSSDSGTVTPAAVQKGAKLFSYERLTDTAVTETAIPRFKKSTVTINGVKYSGLENTNITIQSVKNSANNNSASVLCIPAEGGKKMVYGYCTDQVDGTSFIGGVFPSDATSFPYSAGLAIGGTSGNLLWKGKVVATTDQIPTNYAKTNAANSFSAANTFNSTTTFKGNIILNSALYGASLPSSTTDGQLYFMEDNSPSLPSGGATNQILISNASGNAQWHSIAKSTDTSKRYLVNTGSASGLDYVESVYTQDNVLFGAAWNDYAEFRAQKEIIEPGYCVASNDNGQVYKTTEKYQACDGIVSDTYGFAIGETKQSNTPLAVAGRVLAYFEGNREDYHAGDTVCAGPNGKVCKMTREEIREWPDRIIGIVSEIPQYETWGENNIKVNNRIWIKIK